MKTERVERLMKLHRADEVPQDTHHVHGATFDAAALLMWAGGCINAEANMRVQRFEEEGVRRPEHPV